MLINMMSSQAFFFAMDFLLILYECLLYIYTKKWKKRKLQKKHDGKIKTVLATIDCEPEIYMNILSVNIPIVPSNMRIICLMPFFTSYSFGDKLT